MIAIFARRIPQLDNVAGKLYVLRMIGTLLLWLMLLVSVMVGRLYLRNIIVLGVNVCTFSCIMFGQ